MKAQNDILEAIGNTPLVRLQRLVGPEHAAVYCKCEFMNPSGSVKDRFVVHTLDQAFERGEIVPGGTVVENTSGNTGAAIATWAAVRGVRCIFTIPDKMSREKIDTLKALGAEVVVCPTNVPADSPDSYYETAKRLAKETGGYYLNQYHNPANIAAHYRRTGPEIWEQTEGQIDYFVAGLGTGGTMSGAGRYLKEQKPDIINVGVDPVGSVFHSLFKTGKADTPHVYKVEGIGEDMVCGALDFNVLNDVMQVTDAQCFSMARQLARREGIFAGGSSGGSVHVAVELAKTLGPDKTIVAICTDGGKSYISKLYSDEWMTENGFRIRPELAGTVGDVLATKADHKLHSCKPGDSVAEVIGRLKALGISQMPVLNGGGHPAGMLHEVDVLDALVAGRVSPDDSVEPVLRPLDGVLSADATVEQLREVLSRDLVAVVREGAALVGIVTKMDLIDYVAQQGGRR